MSDQTLPAPGYLYGVRWSDGEIRLTEGPAEAVKRANEINEQVGPRYPAAAIVRRLANDGEPVEYTWQLIGMGDDPLPGSDWRDAPEGQWLTNEQAARRFLDWPWDQQLRYMTHLQEALQENSDLQMQGITLEGHKALVRLVDARGAAVQQARAEGYQRAVAEFEGRITAALDNDRAEGAEPRADGKMSPEEAVALGFSEDAGPEDRALIAAIIEHTEALRQRTTLADLSESLQPQIDALNNTRSEREDRPLNFGGA